MMSKKDSDDKSNFVKSGLNKRYQKGFPCGKAPIGFLNDKFQDKGNRGWIVDKIRFGKLQLLFARFLKGNDSLNTITSYAQEHLKLTTVLTKRQGGKIVGRSMVEHILKNPIYAGFFYSKDEQGNKRSLRSLHKDLPLIITEEDHIKILNIFGARHHPKQQKHLTPYTGYIVGKDNNTIGADVKLQVICDCSKKFAYRSKTKCPACGVNITKMKTPKYLSYTYYFNIKRRKTKGLSSKSIEEKKVDQVLIDLYKKELHLTEQQYTWAKQHLEELKIEELERDKKRTKIYQKEKEELDLKKEKIRKLFIEELLSFEEFKKESEKLEALYNYKKEQQNYSENWYEQIDNLLDTLFNFEAIIEKSDYNA